MKIEEIRDILRFINGFFTEKNRSLDLKNPDFGDSKVGEFYKILMNTKIQGDAEAAHLIYGSTKPDSKYMFLKSHFISRMLNTITRIDLKHPKVSEVTKAVYTSYKNLFIISILLRIGRRKAVRSLLMKTLRITEKYELHHPAIELLEQLRNFANLEGKKILYEKYVRALERKLALLSSESKVNTLVHRLEIHSSVSTYLDESLLAQAGESLQSIERELVKYDTYANRIGYFRLQYMYYQYSGNALKSIAACRNAIAYMHTKPHLTPRIRIGEFKLRILENYTLARDYKHGKTAAAECAEYISSDSSLWIQYKEQYFLLLMAEQDFAEAKIIYDEAMTYARLPSQLHALGERWEIYTMYLHYFIESKKKRSYPLRQKKYQKMIREFPTYSKDKRGLNVAMLLFNIILLLENNKKDLVIAQADALRSYKTSHLKKKHSHQSSILFKLIDIMVKNEFDFAKIKKKAAIYEKRLAATKPSRYEIVECVQIMPPMWMWQRMRAALEAQ